jgi:dTDP-glucose 4,6-dehydratase
MDGSRLTALGWRNGVTFAAGLRDTVEWYRDNETWWQPLRTGDWNEYYERQYTARLERGTEVSVTAPDDPA